MKTRRTSTQTKKANPAAVRARSAGRAVRKTRPGQADPKPSDYIEAAARVLGLPIEPDWHAAIEANFTTTLRLAALFIDFPLPDEAEPAPVFGAQWSDSEVRHSGANFGI